MNARRPTGAQRVTLKDIAARAGVDVSTVSKLLNGDARLRVSNATRARIESVVDELNYVPNLAARSLRTSQGHLLVVMVPSLGDPLNARLVTAAQERAAEAGYLILLGDASAAPAATSPIGHLRRCLQAGVVGAVVYSSVLTDTDPDALADVARHMPIVALNGEIDGTPHSASWDDVAAMRLAADHLAEDGHRRVALLSGPSRHAYLQRRIAAFIQRLAGHGMHCTTFEAEAERSPAAAAAASHRIFEAAPDVTAVITTHPMLAVGVLEAARTAARRVPHELSVVGIHDADIAEFAVPSLTVVDTPVELLGAAAVDHLLDVVAGRQPGRLLLDAEPRLVVRGSSGPPAPVS